jgi:hypothetical protein
MKQLVILFLSGLACIGTHAQMSYQWVKSAGGNNSYEVTALGVDNYSYIYAGVHTVLHKYHPNGQELWTKNFGEIKAIQKDNNGDMIVAGHFTGQLILDAYTLNSASANYDMFITKINTNGDVLWAKRFGVSRLGAHSDEEGINDIAVDATNHIYIGGWFIDSTRLDQVTLTAHGDSDFFLAKLDANGDVIWARNGGTNLASSCAMGDRERTTGIALDNNNNVYICGRTAGTTVYADALTIPSTIDALVFDAMVAKYDNNGNAQWLNVYESTQWEECNEITALADGIVVTGYNMGDISFGVGTSSTSPAQKTMFVFKTNFSGVGQWLKSYQTTNDMEGFDIESDAMGNVYVTGAASGSGTIEGNAFSTSTLNPNVFVLSYTSAGTYNWMRTGGGMYDDWFNELALLTNNDIVLGGLTWDPSTFGSITTTESGYMLARLSDPANPGGLGTTSIQNESNMLLYPNPVFGGIINIQLPATEECMLSIVSMAGKQVFQKIFQPQGGLISIPVDFLTSGTYLVEVNMGQQTLTKKLWVP